MERRLILLIVCTIMVCGLAATGFADNVIRKEFVPVDETPQWVNELVVFSTTQARWAMM